jgi:hypothetical protein
MSLRRYSEGGLGKSRKCSNISWLDSEGYHPTSHIWEGVGMNLVQSDLFMESPKAAWGPPLASLTMESGAL